jgi:hypothetical protein
MRLDNEGATRPSSPAAKAAGDPPSRSLPDTA